MDPQFKQYTNRVRYLTECNLRANNIVIDDRFKYNIDHLFPIKKGFELGIPEDLVASIDNLQIMDWKLNREKGSRITKIPENIFEYMIENEIYVSCED